MIKTTVPQVSKKVKKEPKPKLIKDQLYTKYIHIKVLQS